MKKPRGLQAALVVVVLLAAGLSACSQEMKDGIPVSSIENAKDNGDMKHLVENGVRDLPGKPGYKVRQYVNVHQNVASHYLYVIEKDDVPVAGASTGYQSGKSSYSTVSVMVRGSEEKGGKTIHCSDIADCTKQLAELEKPDPDYLKYQELKKRFEPTAQ